MNSLFSNNQLKLLYEVSYIRPIVIFLLVLLHSFEKISAGGNMVQEYHLFIGYEWLVHLIKGFRIETIALVAGYVFAYQSIDLRRKVPFGVFVKKKFFRLIVPMLFFSTIYYFCFFFDASKFEFGEFVVSLFSGCGHLWFLPMLFWCFIVIWVIDRFNLNSWILLLTLAFLSVIPSLNIPFGFGKLPHFLFFVYAGYYLWTRKKMVMKFKDCWSFIFGLWGIYVILVIVQNLFLPDIIPSCSIQEKLIILSIRGGVGLLISCCGIMALYLTICHYTEREGFAPSQYVIDASKDCYGVYVFHQFILVWLYFYTPLVKISPNELVPWIGFVVASITSMFLTRVSLKSKLGRFLIG